VDRANVEGWIQAYVRAWGSNDPAEIAALFTEDARHFTAPYRQPWVGTQRIVEGWLGRRDEQGTWAFRLGDVTVAGDVAFARGVTTYEDNEYWNLWEIRLEGDGRASEFVEWWMDAVDADKTT
jgi:ketosteroid isomerase-like protein